MIDWIAFDADDTLWKNEEYYLTSNTGQSVINSLQPGTVKVRGIVQDEEDGSLTDKWKIKITEIL